MVYYNRVFWIDCKFKLYICNLSLLAITTWVINNMYTTNNNINKNNINNTNNRYWKDLYFSSQYSFSLSHLWVQLLLKMELNLLTSVRLLLMKSFVVTPRLSTKIVKNDLYETASMSSRLQRPMKHTAVSWFACLYYWYSNCKEELLKQLFKRWRLDQRVRNTFRSLFNKSVMFTYFPIEWKCCT